MRRATHERKRRTYQVFTDLQVINAYEDDLSPEHVGVLRAAARGNDSYGQIAARLLIPIGTFKSRLYRARVALKALAEDDRQAEIAAKHEEPQP